MATLNTTNRSTCGTQSDFQVAEGYRAAVRISAPKCNVSLHVGYLGPGTGWPSKWGTACECKEASFHILFRKLSTLITPFYATLVTCATEQMMFNKSKNINCQLCSFSVPLSSPACLSYVTDRVFTNDKTHSKFRIVLMCQVINHNSQVLQYFNCKWSLSVIKTSLWFQYQTKATHYTWMFVFLYRTKHTYIHVHSSKRLNNLRNQRIFRHTTRNVSALYQRKLRTS
jgi:hypothetical protein